MCLRKTSRWNSWYSGRVEWSINGVMVLAFPLLTSFASRSFAWWVSQNGWPRLVSLFLGFRDTPLQHHDAATSVWEQSKSSVFDTKPLSIVWRNKRWAAFLLFFVSHSSCGPHNYIGSIIPTSRRCQTVNSCIFPEASPLHCVVDRRKMYDCSDDLAVDRLVGRALIFQAIEDEVIVWEQRGFCGRMDSPPTIQCATYYSTCRRSVRPRGSRQQVQRTTRSHGPNSTAAHCYTFLGFRCSSSCIHDDIL